MSGAPVEVTTESGVLRTDETTGGVEAAGGPGVRQEIRQKSGDVDQSGYGPEEPCQATRERRGSQQGTPGGQVQHGPAPAELLVKLDA